MNACGRKCFAACRAGLLGSVLIAQACATGSQRTWPDDAPNCSVPTPPESAGAYVTPGGFLLVHPRNAQFGRAYTGCRTIWVVQDPQRTPLLMRQYFENGELRTVEAWNGRGGASPVARCAARDDEPRCAGLADNPLMSHDLPTWPRFCIEQAERPECSADPE